MGSLANDYDLLLSAPNPVEAALAKDLLAEHGIPSFTSGRDRDMAELGSGVHNAITRPDVFVPKGMRERAQAIIDEAWDAEPLPDEGTGPEALDGESDPKWSSSADTVLSTNSSGTSWTPILAVILVAIVFVLLWALTKL